MKNTVSRQVIDWYIDNKRDLPWRKKVNAFNEWLSEIILQQTRVSQGMAYYHKFVERFDAPAALAAADEEEILRLWQGLGYYSRARNLHQAAKQIVERHYGTFPNDYKSIRALKGVGDYTAAAIASIVFSLPYATVDGNVYRVLSRYFGISTPIDSTVGKKEFAAIAEQILDKNQPGIHNQAMMEFGALQCTPQNPQCHICPLRATCIAYRDKIMDKLPVKQGKIKQRKRYFHYFYTTLKNEAFFAIRQRLGKDIWQNMYEFPMLEFSKTLKIDQIVSTPEFAGLFGNKKLLMGQPTSPLLHKLTHQQLYCVFIPVELTHRKQITTDVRWVDEKSVEQFALPRVIEQFLEQKNGLV